MKKYLLFFVLFFAPVISRAQLSGITVPFPALSSSNTYTFDIERVLDSVSVYTIRGGGYITVTSSSGEVWKRNFNTAVTPAPPELPYATGFTKLATSFTIGYAYTSTACPQCFVLNEISYARRVAANVVLQAANPTPAPALTGVSLPENVAASSFSILAQASGASITVTQFPINANQVCVPLVIADSKGNTLETTTICFQAVY